LDKNTQNMTKYYFGLLHTYFGFALFWELFIHIFIFYFAKNWKKTQLVQSDKMGVQKDIQGVFGDIRVGQLSLWVFSEVV